MTGPEGVADRAGRRSRSSGSRSLRGVGASRLVLLLAATTLWACGLRPFDPEEHLRDIVEAEAAFAEGNGGVYGSLDCLRAPVICVPALHSDAPSLLREWQASPNPAPGWAGRLYLGPSGATTYTFVFAPVDPRFGVRSYCADDTGTIRWTSENRMAVLAGGRCPKDWEPLGAPEP